MMESSSNTAAAPVDKEEANDRHRLDENLNGTLGLAESLQGDLSHVLTEWVESLPERVELRIDCCKANESPEEMSMKRSSTSFTESFNDAWVLFAIVVLRVLITVVAGSLLVGMGCHPRAVLPLAVVVCLYPSTTKMHRNLNVIRVLGAWATMGNATSICSDKTSFDSGKKRSSVPTNHLDGFSRLYTNGDSKTILAGFSQCLTRSGEVADMMPAKRQELEELILTMANSGITFCLAHIDYGSVSELDEGDKTDSSVVWIGGPLHGNAKGPLAHCIRVMVRPVTCDSMNTTGAITKECGDALEGRAFRAKSSAQLDEEGEGLHGKNDTSGLFPGSPKDLLLHGNSQGWEVGNKAGEAVGDTVGGSTNDAPSPRGADVGLRIGITDSSHETLSAAKTGETRQTGLPRRVECSDELTKHVLGRSEEKVAHDAFDMIVLDDNFSFIVRAIMSGRVVFDDIRKFLQFQLTVCVVALMIVLIGRLSGQEPPFNPITVLWFSLIMTRIGALALGTMSPTMAQMDRRPNGRTSPPISRSMFRDMKSQPVFQRVPCIHKHLTCQSWTIRVPNHEEDYRHHSIMFNPFGFGMAFSKLALFKDLHNHLLFIGVFMAIFELARLVDMDAIIKTVRRSPAKIGGHSMPILIVLLLFASVGDVMANGTGVDSDGGDTGEVHVCKGDFCVTAKVAILVPLGTALLVAGGFCWRRALACCSCCCRLWCWPSATEGNIMTDSPPQQQADAQPLMQTQVSNLVTLVRILFVAFVTMLTGTRRVAPVSRAPSVGGVSLV